MIDATTNLYFKDGSSFGSPHAKPTTRETADRTFSSEDIDRAAFAGSAGLDVHPDLLAAMCTRYLDLAQNESALSSSLRVAQGVAAARERELVAERLECERLAELHRGMSRTLAEIQILHRALVIENVELRRRLADTVVVDVDALIKAGGVQ